MGQPPAYGGILPLINPSPPSCFLFIASHLLGLAVHILSALTNNPPTASLDSVGIEIQFPN